MADQVIALHLASDLSAERRDLLADLARRNVADHGEAWGDELQLLRR